LFHYINQVLFIHEKGGKKVAENIIRTLENKGINVPEHHIQLLLAQWEAFQQIKNNPYLARLTDENIDLKYVPGGDKV
jgi:ribosomal protein L12E/L44/L45/RPP1/RPP2